MNPQIDSSTPKQRLFLHVHRGSFVQVNQLFESLYQKFICQGHIKFG